MVLHICKKKLLGTLTSLKSESVGVSVVGSMTQFRWLPAAFVAFLNMAKRGSRRRKSSLIIMHGNAASRCPHCGATEAEKRALEILDGLARSQSELCTVLRLAARQLLQFVKDDDRSLERIRVVLKRAENIQRTISLSEPEKDLDELQDSLAPSVAGYIPDLTLPETPTRIHKVQRSRLTRPFAHAVPKSRTGKNFGSQ